MRSRLTEIAAEVAALSEHVAGTTRALREPRREKKKRKIDKRIWTAEEDELLRKLYREYGVAALEMRLIGRSARAIRIRAGKLGVTRKRLSTPR